MPLHRRRFLAIAIALVSTHSFGQVAVGEPAPSYLGLTTTGNELQLADFKGKVVVASFWASWCGPCRHELPLLEGMQKLLGPEKVKVVAISIEDREMFRQIRRFSGDMSVQFTHDYNGVVSKAYGRRSVPHLVVIDKEGRLRQTYVGYSEQQADKIVEQVQRTVQEQ